MPPENLTVLTRIDCLKIGGRLRHTPEFPKSAPRRGWHLADRRCYEWRGLNDHGFQILSLSDCR